MSSAPATAPVNLGQTFGSRGNGLLSRYVAALRQAVPVEEVWLFGSCARSEAGRDSDVDLLVVLADDHGLARPTLACYRALRQLHSGVPTDVVAISRRRWREEQAAPFGLFGEVCRQGVQLYANRREESAALV
jgi:uncharacterized protein